MHAVKQALTLMVEGRDFDSLSDALMDLSPEQACTAPGGWPNSIATVVFHIWFWQDRWLKQISDIHCEPFGGDNSDFVVIEAADWVATRDKFLAGFAQLRQRANHEEVYEKPTQFGDTVETLLIRAALHTAYHVGQIVLLRGLL